MSGILNLNDQVAIEMAVRRVLLDACKPDGILRRMVAEEVRGAFDDEWGSDGGFSEMSSLLNGVMEMLLEMTEDPVEAEVLRRHVAHRQLLDG